MTLDIRQHYKPTQPTVRLSVENVSYQEVLPDFRLQNFIYCYWQFKTNKPLEEPFNHLIVADGCIDVYFELNKPQYSYVMGFCNQYTEFLLENTFNYVGIRFLPTMFTQLFKINSKELSNRFESLDNVIPKTSKFIASNFSPELNLNAIKSNLDDYFISIIKDTSFNWDNRFYESIMIILKSSGMVDIEKGLQTGLSSRQLRRLFEFHIGGSIKSFCNVVRFQNFLNTYPSDQNLKQNNLFYELGYYDQAHFIKEFKNYYGQTPNKALKK